MIKLITLLTAALILSSTAAQACPDNKCTPKPPTTPPVVTPPKPPVITPPTNNNTNTNHNNNYNSSESSAVGVGVGIADVDVNNNVSNQNANVLDVNLQNHNNLNQEQIQAQEQQQQQSQSSTNTNSVIGGNQSINIQGLTPDTAAVQGQTAKDVANTQADTARYISDTQARSRRQESDDYRRAYSHAGGGLGLGVILPDTGLDTVGTSSASCATPTIRGGMYSTNVSDFTMGVGVAFPLGQSLTTCKKQQEALLERQGIETGILRQNQDLAVLKSCLDMKIAGYTIDSSINPALASVCGSLVKIAPPTLVVAPPVIALPKAPRIVVPPINTPPHAVRALF